MVGVLAFDRFVDDADWFNSNCDNSKSQVLIRVLAFNVMIWFGYLFDSKNTKKKERFKLYNEKKLKFK